MAAETIIWKGISAGAGALALTLSGVMVSDHDTLVKHEQQIVQLQSLNSSMQDLTKELAETRSTVAVLNDRLKR